MQVGLTIIPGYFYLKEFISPSDARDFVKKKKKPKSGSKRIMSLTRESFLFFFLSSTREPRVHSAYTLRLFGTHIGKSKLLLG